MFVRLDWSGADYYYGRLDGFDRARTDHDNGALDDNGSDHDAACSYDDGGEYDYDRACDDYDDRADYYDYRLAAARTHRDNDLPGGCAAFCGLLGRDDQPLRTTRRYDAVLRDVSERRSAPRTVYRRDPPM